VMQRPALPAFAPGPDYYPYVARGYDLAGRHYDEIEGQNAISERVRTESIRAALLAFRPGDRVLELGCGTGRDAVMMASHGIRVLATDVSPAMIAITRERAEREGVADLVEAAAMPAAAAANLDGPFDGAYSNGAVFNLEPDMERVSRGLARSLRPHARAIVTAANRASLFELLFYPCVLRPRKAFRKLRDTVPIPISRGGPGKKYVVPTRFLSPSQFIAQFASAFIVEDWKGLQILTPPWNLVDMAVLFRGAVAPMEAVEDRVSRWRGLRSMGAIYLLVLRRKGF